MAISNAQIQSYIAKAQRAQEVGMLSIVQGKRSGQKGNSLYYPMRFLSAGVDVLTSNHGLSNQQVEIIVQEMIEQGHLNDFSGDPIPYQTIYVTVPSAMGIRITDLIDGPGGSLSSYVGRYLKVTSPTAWSFVSVAPSGVSIVAGIVAFAGGGQGSATPLTGNVNYVDTVASNGDSVIMPTALVGPTIEILNSTGNDVDIFPQVGENFYGQSVNDPFILAGGNSVKFVSPSSGLWRQN